MQIFVDADACPVVGIVEKVAKEHSRLPPYVGILQNKSLR